MANSRRKGSLQKLLQLFLLCLCDEVILADVRALPQLRADPLSAGGIQKMREQFLPSPLRHDSGKKKYFSPENVMIILGSIVLSSKQLIQYCEKCKSHIFVCFI